MRFLFVHQNFPGQFLHFVRHLVAEGGHEILFITEPNGNEIPGVRKVLYRGPALSSELPAALARAAAVAGAAATLRGLGFRPDIVIGHHGWGEMLDLGDVWPDVPMLGYYEFFYRTTGLDVGFDPEFPIAPGGLGAVRAKNAINLLALSNGGWGQTPTWFQHGTYPDWARERIAVLPEGVDLAVCRPDPAVRARPVAIGGLSIEPGDELLTYVSRDLEPYRGFHVLMRALPALLAARPRLKAVLVGGDGVSYGASLREGSWRALMLAQVGGLDAGRVAFPGKVGYGEFVTLLQRSDVHVYLTYPFVASWSLREAMACGCAIVGSDTAPVREFVTEGESGVLTPCLDPVRLAERVDGVLADGALRAALRAGARGFAERALRMDQYLAGYRSLVNRVVMGSEG